MPEETAMQERLYRLAKRLNVGRILRYGDLWTRYLWRRGLSAVDAARSRPAGGDAATLGAALAAADIDAAKRMAVASWSRSTSAVRGCSGGCSRPSWTSARISG
jgi:hypothetical protein